MNPDMRQQLDLHSLMDLRQPQQGSRKNSTHNLCTF
jgi:hypothetical protein